MTDALFVVIRINRNLETGKKVAIAFCKYSRNRAAKKAKDRVSNQEERFTRKSKS